MEDQAFPFEDKAIEFHQINLGRLKTADNPWLHKSLDALKRLTPARYGRSAKVSFMNKYAHLIRRSLALAAVLLLAACAGQPAKESSAKATAGASLRAEDQAAWQSSMQLIKQQNGQKLKTRSRP